MNDRPHDPVRAAEQNPARNIYEDDDDGALKGHHVLSFIETSRWKAVTKHKERDNICEKAALWWNRLVDLSPPDAGQWPTCIAPEFDTEGNLRKLTLSDDGGGHFNLTILIHDEDVIDINGSIHAGHGEGNFHTKDLITYD